MLLIARKQPLLERLHAAYARRLLRRSFAAVRVSGAAWPETAGPTIAFVNHSAWWDPVLTLFLSHEVLRRDGYGVMLGTSLQRFPFFRRIGCFGTTTSSVDDTRALVEYATGLMAAGHRRTLWLFPQGALLPARAELRFRSGLARFARALPEAPLLPVAVRYEMRNEQRPECFVRFGEAITPAASVLRPAVTRMLEAQLRVELATLDEALACPTPPGFRTVLEGRGSLSGLYDATFGRVAAAVRRRDRAAPLHLDQSPGLPLDRRSHHHPATHTSPPTRSV